MTEIKLSKAEAKVLTDAVAEGGRITLPLTMKVTARERLIGRLIRDGLATAGEDGEHTLAPAGYRVVGLEPPRAAAGSKKAIVTELLRREERASLAELVASTGWQPHTTRAVLSRLRTGGDDELAKSKRPDGVTAYRLQPRASEPPSAPKRTGRAKTPADVRVAA